MRHFIASGVKHTADKHAADKRVMQENEYSDFANYPQPTLQTAIVANWRRDYWKTLYGEHGKETI